MCDSDPTQFPWARPGWLHKREEVKYSCEKLGGEKENRRKGITAYEQGENVKYSGLHFLSHRGNGRGARPGGLDGGSELGEFGLDASNCIRG
jgi:hypothetical protein